MIGSDRLPPLVFGPAYLDRVVRVDRPLIDPSVGNRALDRSVDGSWAGPGGGLIVTDPLGNRIVVELPSFWMGPTGRIAISRPLAEEEPGWSWTVRALSWAEDLGGMGSGFAAALGGELVSVLGPRDDPLSLRIAGMLASAGVVHHPVRVAGTAADWTLLFSSGEHGDKLPIGFRGCHASAASLQPWSGRPSGLRVVAALPNRLSAEALGGPARVRMFAPAPRNMIDRDPPVSAFAESVDVLCCNRGEWESLPDREEVAWRVSILAVTDGPNGAVLRFTTPEGEVGRLEVPAFPRSLPPRDTNRAGEAFASTLIATLIGAGWTPGVTPPGLIRLAAERASAAAALVLDRTGFGFPTPGEVDAAIRSGRVDAPG